MKKETRQIKTVSYEEVFVAEDGSIFKSETECKKYEESALFSVRCQLMKKALVELPKLYGERTTGALYFGMETVFGCCEDYDFYLFCPETDEDIGLFLQFAELLMGKNALEPYKKRTKEEYPNVAERLIVDDSDKWEGWKQFVDRDHIEKGKKYIFQYLDGWGSLFDTEMLKKVPADVVDTIIEQFAK